MKKLIVLMTAATLSAAIPANAQQLDMSTVKCRDFVSSSKENIALMLMWLQGFYSEQDASPIVDFDQMKKDAQKLGEYCAKNPDHSVITAVDEALRIDHRCSGRAAVSELTKNSGGTMPAHPGRILVTHVGSLIRPPQLVEHLRKIEAGEPYDATAYEACLKDVDRRGGARAGRRPASISSATANSPKDATGPSISTTGCPGFRPVRSRRTRRRTR